VSVVVVGSGNVDLVSQVERIPSPGETVLSTGFATHAGGKGNNQATAAARAGADTTFVGAFGDVGRAEECRDRQRDDRERRGAAPADRRSSRHRGRTYFLA